MALKELGFSLEEIGRLLDDGLSLEQMRHLFKIVLVSAQIVIIIAEQWLLKTVLWLRLLGGKLGIPTNRDGNYWLQQGISAVVVTCSTLSFVFLHPFPFQEFTCG